MKLPEDLESTLRKITVLDFSQTYPTSHNKTVAVAQGSLSIWVTNFIAHLIDTDNKSLH